jgi:CDP-diacylglycerol--serine O-phosphatidyltransferase
MKVDFNETRMRRGIFLLPNLLTTCCLFGGFYAIVASIDGNFERATIAIFVAMIFDGLDGRVARLMGTETTFGKEFDSLADMVAFGIAPAVVCYQWGVERIAEYGSRGAFGWIAAFFYAAAVVVSPRASIRARRHRTSATSRACQARRAPRSSPPSSRSRTSSTSPGSRASCSPSSSRCSPPC